MCRLRDLVENLPPGSALHRALDPHHEWNQVPVQFLREVAYQLELLRYMWADETSRGAPPQPIPMPWEAEAQRAADEDLVAQLRANERT